MSWEVSEKNPLIVAELEKFFYAVGNWENQKNSRWKRSISKWARFKATDIADGGNWVIKNYIPKEVNNMEALGMTLDDLVFKQVLLHSAARNIARSVMRKDCTTRVWWKFRYEKVCFGFLNDLPLTVQEFIDGKFDKYINNDGKRKTLQPGDMKCVYQKAHSLVHYNLNYLRENLRSLTYREACTIYTSQKLILPSY